VSYYNPASIPNPGGDVSTGVAAISYCNGPDSTYPQYCPAQDAPASAPPLAVESAKTDSAGDSGTTTSLTASISLANGPTATSVVAHGGHDLHAHDPGREPDRCDSGDARRRRQRCRRLRSVGQP